MYILKQIIFLDKFFRDIRYFDVIIFGAGGMDLEFKKISKLTNIVTG